MAAPAGADLPASSADPQAPPHLPGWKVRSLLGWGGFGAVWEATDAAGSSFAIKVSHNADENTRVRLEREAAALAQVGPPYVPVLRESGVLADGRPYLAMERLVGRTLAQEIESWSGPPPLDRVQALGDALLRSVAAMHARRVVHGDLKPENVFLVGEGARVVAKLMDFGLGRRQAPEGGDEQTMTGLGAGTPEYMAPEQISGEPPETFADVYALGLLLYEVLTLRLPFHGDRSELEYAHLSSRPPPPSAFAPVPPALEPVILRCLAKRPLRRFSDAGALRTAFAEALEMFPRELTPVPVLVPQAASESRATGLRGGGERQKMVLLFAQGPRVSEAQAELKPFAGQIAHVGAGVAVYAFGHRASHRPGQRALAAALTLLEKGLARRLVADIAVVRTRLRPDGTQLFSPAFSEVGRYPADRDPLGLQLTAAACALLPSVPCQPSPSRPDHFVPTGSAIVDTLAVSSVPEAVAPLEGRSELIEGLEKEAATAVAERRPRVASVLADPGFGKTRIALELRNRLRSQMPAAEVIELSMRKPLVSDTDENLSALLRRTLDLPVAPPPDGGREILIERLGEIGRETYASAALALGWIASDHPAVTALRAAPGVLRANLVRAGLAAICHLASQRPVLVLIDDVHWADDALLDSLGQATALELPLWVCVFGRPLFAEDRPDWGQRAAHRLIERVGPLDRESAARLCLQLLRPALDVPEPVITRLTERAQGVPLLLCELIHGLRREGLLRQRSGGGTWYVATEVLDRIPESPLADWLVGRELEQLTNDLSAHASLASLLSSEFTVDEVDGILRQMDRDLADLFPLDSDVALHRLQQTGLLVQQRPAAFAFRSGILRDAVARSIGADLARRIHRAALAFYRLADLPEFARLARLARHAAEVGERREAGRAYLALGEWTRERHRYLEADLLYSKALAQLEADDEASRLSALKGRGVMRYRLGRYEGSLEDLAQARELAVQSGDPASQMDVMLDEAMALDWVFQWRRSRDLVESARELSSRVTDGSLEARLLLAEGRSLYRFNRDRESIEVLRQAARQAEELGDQGYEVSVTANLLLGAILACLGHIDEAERRLEEVDHRCEAKSDELHRCAMWGNRSTIWLARNDRERFMQDMARVLDYARRMGSANLERFANFNTATFLYWRGETAEAERHARRVIEIEDGYFGQQGFQPDGLVLLARILSDREDRASAAGLVADVQSHQATAREQGKTHLLLQPTDAVLLDMVALAVGHASLELWQPLVERARQVAQGQELIEVIEMAGVTAQRRGDLDGARRWWQEALAACERIPNVMSARIQARLASLSEARIDTLA